MSCTLSFACLVIWFELEIYLRTFSVNLLYKTSLNAVIWFERQSHRQRNGYNVNTVCSTYELPSKAAKKCKLYLNKKWSWWTVAQSNIFAITERYRTLLVNHISVKTLLGSSLHSSKCRDRNFKRTVEFNAYSYVTFTLVICQCKLWLTFQANSLN